VTLVACARPCRKRLDDPLDDAVDILQDLIVPETEHNLACRLQDGRSLQVTGDVDVMLTAINLNDELRLDAGEVGNESIDRHLPAKLATKLLRAQSRPQFSFCIGRLAAKPPSEMDRLQPLTLLA
jgi:hypothetical protein